MTYNVQLDRHAACMLQVGMLRKEVAELQTRIAEAERLLRLADPDGYYREGTRAAEAAKARGVKALAL